MPSVQAAEIGNNTRGDAHNLDLLDPLQATEILRLAKKGELSETFNLWWQMAGTSFGQHRVRFVATFWRARVFAGN